MKKTKKRGFTIVELVIVIAVIAILAAVMVPTFSNVISKAKEAKALQEARGAWDEYVAKLVLDGSDVPTGDGAMVVDNIVFHIEKGQFNGQTGATEGTTFNYVDGSITGTTV